MAWGLHWSTSGPGANDLWWTRRVADYVASMPNRSRSSWAPTCTASTGRTAAAPPIPAPRWSTPTCMDLLARTQSASVFDAAVFAPHFSYTDGQGSHHDVWYTDARSIAARVKLARDRGLGVGLWRLGREDQALWSDPVMGA